MRNSSISQAWAGIGQVRAGAANGAKIWLNTVGQGDYTPMMTDPASRGGAQTASRIDPNWVFFLALGFIWGSSYLFIKLAVDDFGTFTLVALRLLVGAALLWTVVRIARQPLGDLDVLLGRLGDQVRTAAGRDQ